MVLMHVVIEVVLPTQAIETSIACKTAWANKATSQMFQLLLAPCASTSPYALGLLQTLASQMMIIEKVMVDCVSIV